MASDDIWAILLPYSLQSLLYADLNVLGIKKLHFMWTEYETCSKLSWNDEIYNKFRRKITFYTATIIYGDISCFYHTKLQLRSWIVSWNFVSFGIASTSKVKLSHFSRNGKTLSKQLSESIEINKNVLWKIYVYKLYFTLVAM